MRIRAQGLCESGGDLPGLPVPNSPYGLCGRKATDKAENMRTFLVKTPSASGKNLAEMFLLWTCAAADSILLLLCKFTFRFYRIRSEAFSRLWSVILGVSPGNVEL